MKKKTKKKTKAKGKVSNSSEKAYELERDDYLMNICSTNNWVKLYKDTQDQLRYYGLN